MLEKISEENCKLKAARNILENGRTMLNNALVNPSFQKTKVIEANDLIQMGSQKISNIEKKMFDLNTEADKMKCNSKIK